MPGEDERCDCVAHGSYSGCLAGSFAISLLTSTLRQQRLASAMGAIAVTQSLFPLAVFDTFRLKIAAAAARTGPPYQGHPRIIAVASSGWNIDSAVVR